MHMKMAQIAATVHVDYALSASWMLSYESEITDDMRWLGSNSEDNHQVRQGDQPRYPRLLWPLRWTIAHSIWMVPLLKRNDILLCGCRSKLAHPLFLQSRNEVPHSGCKTKLTDH